MHLQAEFQFPRVDSKGMCVENERPDKSFYVMNSTTCRYLFLLSVIFFFYLLSFSLRCTRLVTSPISMDSDWLIPIYDLFLMTHVMTHLLVCVLVLGLCPFR